MTAVVGLLSWPVLALKDKETRAHASRIPKFWGALHADFKDFTKDPMGKATQQGGGLAPGNVRGMLEELRESHVFHKLLSLKAK